MDDFLDRELGDFDWGPSRREPLGFHYYVIMAAIGSALLTIGLFWACTSYLGGTTS